ncbi:MAG: ABC transporter substrate-binding protein [Meiothermus silvanus]|nr:ABC transporter substrate-binding protein [Allomeiothermus silvanus]
MKKAGIASIIGFVLALGLGLAQRPNVSGEVNLMAYAGIFQDNYVEAVVKPFMQRYPNIRINYIPAQNSAAMLAQLRAQKGNPQVDVAIMDVSVARTGTIEDLFAELDAGIVTNLKDLYPEAFTPGVHGPAVTFDHLAMIYNPELVKPAPTSWLDLWDMKYKGQVVVPAPPDIQGLALTILINKIMGADYKKTIDPAITKLKELAPLVQTYDPKPDQYTLIINGTAGMAVSWNARSQLYSDLSKGKLKVVLPKEGTVFQINTINLVKGSKNSEAAQLFINYALSPAAQKAFTERMFYAPVNKKALIGTQAILRTAAAPKYREKVIPVDWLYIATIRDQWLERWRREIITVR